MATQTVVQQSLPPEYIQQRTQELLNTVFGTGTTQGLIETPRPIPGQQIADLAPTTQALVNAAGQVQVTPETLGIGAFQPFMQQAQLLSNAAAGSILASGEAFDPTDANTGVTAFMSPYQQNVTQEALAEIDRQGALAEQKAKAQAVQAGSFGGAREGVLQAELARNLQDIKSKRIAEDLQQNYLQALATAQAAQEGQRARQLYGGAQLGALAGREAALGLTGQQAVKADVGLLTGLGSLGTTQEQAQLEAERQNILAQQAEPYTRLGFGQQILSGVPAPSQQITAQPYNYNPYLQALQTGILGLGVLGGSGGIGLDSFIG